MAIPVVNISATTKSSDSTSQCVFNTVILKKGLSLAEQLTDINTKYVVKWNYDLLTASISIPFGCILDFDGGQISNGSIQWNDTKIHNPYKYEILKNISESGHKIDL